MAERTVPAAEFKAKCLSLLDRVRERGEPITITKRGRVVARLVPAGDEADRPWLRLRGTVTRYDDPFEPAIDEREIEDRAFVLFRECEDVGSGHEENGEWKVESGKRYVGAGLPITCGSGSADPRLVLQYSISTNMAD
jgi:prevent-host-death family protein